MLFQKQLHIHVKSQSYSTNSLPEAKLVPLVGEMLAAVEVEGLEGARARLGKEVLRAARGSPVVEVAGVLGYLEV